MQFRKGFTLLELLVVVAIISILAGIALPTYQKNTTRARVSELVRVLDSLTQQVIQSYNSKGKMPASLENVDGVGLLGNGDYGAYVIPNMTTHLHYDNGTNWTNIGAVVQVAISSEIGKGIPGFVESVNGKNGVGNSISMAFFEDNGTLKIYCGRWDSSSALYIPLEFLPTGCNSDNIQESVTGN